MRQLTHRVAPILAMTYAVSLPSLADDLPWAFKGKSADGYSIDLVTAEPTPGSPLVAGSKVEFRLTVSYTMSIAKSGTIILVFQDEKNRNAQGGKAQVTQAVSDPGGTVSLSETITVPSHAEELRLFIPLVPNGLTNTSGEVTLRYPITNK